MWNIIHCSDARLQLYPESFLLIVQGKEKFSLIFHLLYFFWGRIWITKLKPIAFWRDSWKLLLRLETFKPRDMIEILKIQSDKSKEFGNKKNLTCIFFSSDEKAMIIFDSSFIWSKKEKWTWQYLKNMDFFFFFLMILGHLTESKSNYL